MTTARDLIQDALIEIGVHDPSETMDATTAQFGLRTLNRIKDRLNLTGCFVYSIRRQVFDLAFDSQDYTFGSGGLFNTADNGRIVRAGLILSDGSETPLCMVDYRAWADISVKFSSGQPAYLWDQRNEAGGLNTLWFWPIPDSNAYDVALYTQHEIADFATLDTSLSAPPIYEELILTELGIALAGALHAQVPDTFILRNRKAWEAVSADNQLSMPFDPSSHFKPAGSRADYKIGRLI